MDFKLDDIEVVEERPFANHDFWMSISDTLHEGFISEGLAKLDDSAEQSST